MWKRFLTKGLDCCKAIGKICVGVVSYVAQKLHALFINTTVAINDGANWVAEKAEAMEVAKLSKVAMLRAFVLFTGGFICCFLFPEEAKGDLTWFEKMLNTAMDWSSVVVNGVKGRVVSWIQNKWEVGVT